MKVMTRLGTLAVVALLSTPCIAGVEVDLDLRLVESNGRRSFLNEGFGKLRFDAADEGLQLGRIRLAYRGSPVGNWHVNLDASTWSFDDHNVIDLTEAYAEWRPVPTSAWRSQVKIGAFYPTLSFEHRARGWTNPYTLSSSALNTWIGEEFRTVGVGYSLDHLGTSANKTYDFGFEAAAFGWNDPAGVVIALRGFALHDRQTPLFGRIGSYAPGGPNQRVIFSEIDQRVGVHVGGYIRHQNGLELRAMRYDNRGDPAAFKVSINDYAWYTRFNSLGLRYDGGSGTTIILQGLNGYTDIGPQSHDRWKFSTAFVLAAQQLGRHRLAARYDVFETSQLRTMFPRPLGVETGHATTLAWTIGLRDNLDLVAEWLKIDSNYNKRRAIGEQPAASERSLQLALRLALDP
jgi:hypothetical protein